MQNKAFKNSIITVFVIFWILLFQYESLRYFYLQPWLKRELPKTKLLFPPAGWIMFYSIDPIYGHAEVYGVRNGLPQLIDPHDILETRTIGYDNIHRNILSQVLSKEQKRPFCTFLERKFPDFENFIITAVFYNDVVNKPFEKTQHVIYQCEEPAKDVEKKRRKK